MDFPPPTAEHFVHLPFDVPYLPDHRNSNGNPSFSSSPGLAADILLSGQEQLDDFAPVLQSRLFFGLLEEFFGKALGIEVVEADFVQEKDDGTRVLTLDRLPKYIIYWIALEAPTNVGRQRLRQTTACLDAAKQVLSTLAQLPVVASSSSGVVLAGHKTLLAAIILAETLDRARWNVYTLYHELGSEERSWPCSTYCRELLRTAGWCPGELYMLQLSSVATLAYVATFDRQVLGKSHARCTDRRCEAHQIDEGTYETRHATEGCRCEHIVVEWEGHRPITARLRDGKIPVISLRKAPDGVETVVVADTSPDAPYVAISHVWSDGLGNVRGNSLPVCQLRRLQELVDGLISTTEGPVPFWIDTICVPFSDMKKDAIRRMAKVYQGASKTLVLDKSLETASRCGPLDELLTRIRCTPWMQRLWTVQEAVLSRDLYFQFADGPLHPDTFVLEDSSNKTVADVASKYLRPPSNGGINAAIERTIHRALLAEYASEYSEETFEGHEDFLSEIFEAVSRGESSVSLSNDDGVYLGLIVACAGLNLKSPLLSEALVPYNALRNDSCFGEYALPFVAQALRMRTSSKLSDETICIATLLGLDPAPLLAAPTAARMQILLCMMEWVPAALVFADMPRQTVNGFRWAPHSFMWREARYYANLHQSNAENSGSITPGKGLRLKYPVGVFTAPGGLGEAREFNMCHPRPNDDYGSCVVLRDTLPEDSARAEKLAVVRPSNSRGAVVEVLGEEGGVLVTRFLTTSTLSAMNTDLRTFEVEGPYWGQVREVYIG